MMRILKLYHQFSVSLKFPRLKRESYEINAFVYVYISMSKVKKTFLRNTFVRLDQMFSEVGNPYLALVFQNFYVQYS